MYPEAMPGRLDHPSSRLTAAVGAEQALYSGAVECAPPAVCDAACTVLQGCDPAPRRTVV